ncbi:MAG: hypothetical protein JWQ81_7431 [Amycolatopsis sp.]|jgi:hypothetical protein|uniref:DUF742 domain-containing protein n=1 Tax=Amycolatopsis sp. TaxID=37632 RepID=UPI00261D92E1|nr:DUF742 domain-containing protein [Amycolatopsis sp.]MCU1686692.1 hypothetical protein [Amycolatopsis sp.]
MNPDEHRLPDPRMIPAHRPQSWFQAPVEPEPPSYGAHAREDEPEAGGHAVRPFVMTGGRTRPLVDDLRIETLVTATRAALTAPLKFEELTVVRLCQRAHSIAEIGAELHVPVGVARVIVADLVTTGHVSVQKSAELPISVIERMRDLVKAL